MRVSLGRRGDYGVRAMLALASLAPEGRPVSVREISERMAIPVRFLPHVLDVVDAVEPEPAPQRCVLRGGPCRPDGRCSVHDVFDAATTAVRAELRRQSLAELSAVDR
jgi:DNA-binding IscR family transcriptional regulator